MDKRKFIERFQQRAREQNENAREATAQLSTMNNLLIYETAICCLPQYKLEATERTMNEVVNLGQSPSESAPSTGERPGQSDREPARNGGGS